MTEDRELLRRRLHTAVGASHRVPATPIVVVDLDAFDANAADLVRRASGTPIRVASKSIRVPALLSRTLERTGFHGVLAYTLAEALWLVEQEICDDVVVAYPTVDRAAMARLLSDPDAADRITVMIDDTAHLDLIDGLRGVAHIEVRVAIDIDAGLRIGRQHVGPKRSPLYDPADVLALAQLVRTRAGFSLVGAMTYEGQVAGVPDDVPRRRAKSAVVRRMKAMSMGQLAVRRREVADALAAAGVTLEFWNAGGTGSIQATVADPVVTEVAAGSGLLVPTLFDDYRSFDGVPAAFFGVPVTRLPSPGIATVHGGGLIASGAAGADRLPTPWAPAGLHLTGLEGAGEVQTPLTGPGAGGLRIGDLVWFRHAKSGELFEHTKSVHLLSEDHFVDEVATYRGHGLAF